MWPLSCAPITMTATFPGAVASYVQTETALKADTYIGGDVELLKRLLAAGFPIIIEKGLVLEDHDGWMGHYLTLFGYEEASQQFWALDTFLGPFDSVGRLESYEETMRYWRDFNYRFIVVYAPEQETAVHNNILGSTYLDPLAMAQAAERAQTAVNDSPADAFAWSNRQQPHALGRTNGRSDILRNGRCRLRRSASHWAALAHVVVSI
ncbi:MAG: hypothetical protein R3E31_17860 [Chloroflexota bacterium]